MATRKKWKRLPEGTLGEHEHVPDKITSLVARLNKVEIARYIAGKERVVTAQYRQLVELRQQAADIAEERDKFADIGRALNYLAAARRKRDSQKPRQEKGDHDGDGVGRAMTFDRALAFELARIEETVKEVLDVIGTNEESVEREKEWKERLENQRNESREEIESLEAEHESERDSFLRALGIDEYEWQRIQWRYR